MQIIHHLTIDLARQLPVPPIGAVQNDANTRAVEISLLENGEPWNVPEGITAAVAFRKTDKTKGLYDRLPDGSAAVTIEGSTVIAVLAPQVLSCAGEVSAAVVFHDADLNQLATFPFVLRVAANPAAGQTVSGDYYRYSTMEAVSDAVDGFLTKAEEALAVVHDTATEDATAIVCEASGSTISVTDASNRLLQGLTLYGKTVQNGTPTPQSPVALEAAGASGSIGVTVAGKNLWDNANAVILVGGSQLTRTPTGFQFIRGAYTGGVCVYYRIPLVKGQTVTASFSIAGDKTFWYIYADQAYGTPLKNGTGTLTYTADADYPKATFALIWNSGTTDSTLTDIQVEFGDSVTTYEPYKTVQSIAVSTPGGLPGISVTSGGNYTDEKGQAWICDYKDFAKGVNVQNVGRIDSYAGEEITDAFLSTTGQLSTGATVLYALSTPIETPLSAGELAAYAALRTGKPNTTVFNDSGAGMKLSYVADTKLYIDQKLAAISTAILS